MKSRPEQRKQIIAEAVEQRYAEIEGAEIALNGGTANEWSDLLDPVQKEFYSHYRTLCGEYTPEGDTPTTTSHPTLTSNVKFMNQNRRVGVHSAVCI